MVQVSECGREESPQQAKGQAWSVLPPRLRSGAPSGGRSPALHVGFYGCWELRCLVSRLRPKVPGRGLDIPWNFPSHGDVLWKMPLKSAVLLVAALLLGLLPAPAHPNTREFYIAKEPSAPAVISAMGPDLEVVKLVLEPSTRLDIKTLESEATTVMMSAMKHLKPPQKSTVLLSMKLLEPAEKATMKLAMAPSMKLEPPMTIAMKSTLGPSGMLELKPTAHLTVEPTIMKQTHELNVQTTEYLPLDKAQKMKIVA
ncbi:uncharacterized protein [Petaurus breviceps papuanus]|uniref:uncharacterized protein n=1 Tax=Petaurus breviceps papuanus TaxID=3040969 RepID=UPI0036DABAFA